MTVDAIEEELDLLVAELMAEVDAARQMRIALMIASRRIEAELVAEARP